MNKTEIETMAQNLLSEQYMNDKHYEFYQFLEKMKDELAEERYFFAKELEILQEENEDSQENVEKLGKIYDENVESIYSKYADLGVNMEILE